ncbi:MAG TPA: aminotransferase class I/II-fold pyridoxal phosphate-dependent enzyme [Acidimicrobiia bacterium]|nr:aminotransferase class I/II-fold pyridoxal phosphate-dependent enzyme [Acidimicrobiia bacterium]
MAEKQQHRQKRHLHKDTDSVTLGHEALDHFGSLKPPIYQTSTFVFETAEEGKRFFELVYGSHGKSVKEAGYIYSRLDSPSLAPAEARIASWEEAEDAVVFGSGMGAITTLLLTFLRPGDQVVYSMPTYGGTSTLMKGLLTDFGVDTRAFRAGTTLDDLESIADGERLAMVYVETPANPTNDLFDISMAADLADRHDALLVVDNTFLSPVWQKPLVHGADLSLHSATKYLGGHSDLTAGAVCGGVDDIARLRYTRHEIGTTPSPATGWLLGRSIETLRLRVTQQTDNATRIARFLVEHDKVKTVRHLSLLEPGHRDYEIYKRQCDGPGAMVSLEIEGGEAGCFRFLNAMEVVRLATSLGGTESLASHPWTMSPPTVPDADKHSIGVTPGLIRLSVGIEDVSDLIADLDQALARV